MNSFKLGEEYPHEGFVQRAVEHHFLLLGFADVTEGDADFICVHPSTGIRWVVEAKGQTSQVGLDFRTGLGQIIQRMSDQSSCYALAFPATLQFLHKVRAIEPWVRKCLNLHWLVVGPDGKVCTYTPDIPPK